MTGPTNVAVSPGWKALACVMGDGWALVLDRTTWAERAVVKKPPRGLTLDESTSEIRKAAAHPIDLVFSADDKALSLISNTNIVTYDAQTGAETKRVTFKPKAGALAGRHARFSDGSIAVRTWTGSLAIFDAD